MPPGEVEQSTGNDDALKTGYLLRFDQLDKQGMPARIPLLNGHGLKERQAVIFDVFQFQINVIGNDYFIPVAIIPEDLVEFTKNKKTEELENPTAINIPNKDWDEIKEKIKWDEQWGDKDHPLAIEDEKKSKYKIGDLTEIRNTEKLILGKRRSWIIKILSRFYANRSKRVKA